MSGRAVLLALALAALGGCATNAGGGLAVRSALDSNDTSPTRIDIVSVKDRQLIALLSGVDATSYFAMRDQVMRDYPLALHVQSLEVVPGWQLRELVPDRHAAAVFVFVDYRTPGSNRLMLGADARGTLTLERDRFTWMPIRKP